MGQIDRTGVVAFVAIGDDGQCKAYMPKNKIHGTDAEVVR